MKNSKYINRFYTTVLVVTGFFMMACEDEPDKYEVAGGKPTVQYVRVPDLAASDSLLTGAYMANTVCLVGENLRSVYELYFNDRKAILNSSYITDHTLMVDVPKEIPSVVTDKIYMVTKSKDTVSYDFKVLVPVPTVNSMSCEFAKPGNEVTLTGDYFIDDPNVPLTITMAGNVEVTNITSITKTAVSFILPDNAPAGYINVKSIYGTGRSKFRYYDTRNILFDWDGSHGGMSIGHGWRDGSKVLKEADENSIDGAYIRLEGELAGKIGATWNEDSFSFNYWPQPSAGYPELSARPEFAELLKKYGVKGLQLKFEVNIPSSNPWQSCALQVMFTGNDAVTGNTGNNTFFSDTSVPRGLWLPWKNTGTYDTSGKWITVSMNLSEFNKTHEGNKCDTALDNTMLTGLTFFVWQGGVEGKDCNPVIMIDNIRVVPIE